VDSGLAISNPIELQAGLKRGIDLFGAILLLILFSPLILAVSLLLHLAAPGKVIYRQTRIGKDSRKFELFKFRTMQPGAEEGLEEFLDLNPSQRLEFERYQKLIDDPRVTRLGKFLRRYSLDEIPQLWNVIRGEMSLVGPRPFLPEQTRLYGPGLFFYTQIRPGLTGLWQISGRNRLSFQARAECDLTYILSWSVWSDFQILLRTPQAVISQDGAY
jgi:lipopolysaccharide/colanic/teichoic acid biosynthesis glycosyltransferase